jgi:hypothetical protein
MTRHLGVVVVRNSKEPPVVVRNSQEPLVPVVVPVVVPVLVPGGNRLYNAEDKPALAQTDMAAKVGSSSVLMGVAAFVFFGCAFLAISGFIYARTARWILARHCKRLIRITFVFVFVF